MKERRTITASLLVLIGVGALLAFSWQQSGWKTPPAVAHALEGRDNCMMCHKAGAMEPVPDAPASHAGWSNDMCMMCHAKDAAVQKTAPVAIPHALEGRAACTMCHAPGKMEAVPDMPADHKGRADGWCGACHKPAA